MLMLKEREELIKYGKKLVEANLTKGTGGNLSIYDRSTGYVAITPSGIDFYDIELEDIVILDINGNHIEGNRVPSSEYEMHLMQYRTRDDIDAVIHAHTTYVTVFACLRRPMLPSHYMIALAGKDVRCADYATYGTHELAVNAAEAMKGRKAVILANHGILTGANDLMNAFNIIEELEYCAKIHILCEAIGKPVILPDEEMELMLEKFKTYGQRKEK